MRRLTPDERALWGQVAGSVTPIRGRGHPVAPALRLPAKAGAQDKLGFAEAGAGSDVGAKMSDRPRPAPGRRVAVAKPPILPTPSANTLDGSWDKRLRLGQASPDFTIDLHGETLASAHTRLNHSLAIAVRHGARMVLLITGRPARDNPRLPPTSRGVIRASVMDWLAASSYAAHIAAIRGAHPRHGGAGALYVILKRVR